MRYAEEKFKLAKCRHINNFVISKERVNRNNLVISKKRVKS